MSTPKRVLITGASRGIGLRLAQHYKAQGWNVIAAVRAPAAANDLNALHVEKIVAIDTSDEASVLQAVADVGLDTPIDLLINNAGVLTRHSLETATKADLMRQFEINAVGPWLVTRAFLPNLELAKAASGIAIAAQVSSIVASIEQNVTGRNYGYRASKTALNSLNKSLSVDLHDRGVVCVVLHPGYVKTDMTDHLGDITVDESVAGLTTVLARITPADSGKFYHTNGSIIPW
ncbi:Aste57867_2204 [Aphanomyces stellatus]|uniref:Aste57867_2204 protein n=1 Tax=Aphanomyces stellatus TaxID=120398 RepID=A0A485K6Y3_9STRA|nr:hypothetical protein As57867_002199 [Aphanomyces stellatus]VFT79407.1 Aste57867_2204 [Aphanomyces stellatus]